MKKSSFAAMVLGTFGGLLFALGMCMALIEEWGTFTPGVVVGTAGIIVLFITIFVWRKMEHKEPIKLSGKTVGATLIGMAGVLIFGVGMCLTMAWNHMVIGTVIGIAGIIILLCLIPFIKGIKQA